MSLPIFRILLDAIYPRYCLACGSSQPTALPHLCWDCRQEITPIALPFCSRCGNPVPGQIFHEYVCFRCAAREELGLDRARSAVLFEGLVRELIHAFKYQGALWLLGDLTALLIAAYQAHFADVPIDRVTWVPLSPRRQRERGYNQAALLAKELARRVALPRALNLLRRERWTTTQTNLTAPQRISNVRGAFLVSRPVVGQHILIVDDVMTTGATLQECARVLKGAGAAAVYCLTVARGQYF